MTEPLIVPRLFHAFDQLLDKTVFFSFTNIGYALRRPFWDRDDEKVRLDGQVCVVTGANAGLGKAVTTALARRGATVHMLCRHETRGRAAQQAIRAATGNERLFLHRVDMSHQEDIRAFATSFANTQVDILVNNAGVLLPQRQVTAGGIELTFATNVLGYFLLAELLLPALRRAPAARVINVTSGGMYAARLHLDDLQYEQRPYNGTMAYAESKRAEVILTQLWAAAWRDTSVTAHAVHPGWAATPGVRTSLPRFYTLMRPLLRTPRQGADTIVWLCATPGIADHRDGPLWFDRQMRPRHKRGVARNSSDEIAAFWQRCHQLTGLTPPLP